MKTTRIHPRKKAEIKKPLTFPAIFLGLDDNGNFNEDVVFAWTPYKGVVIHAGTTAAKPVGHIYEDTMSRWDECRYWARSTEPVTIKFQP